MLLPNVTCHSYRRIYDGLTVFSPTPCVYYGFRVRDLVIALLKQLAVGPVGTSLSATEPKNQGNSGSATVSGQKQPMGLPSSDWADKLVPRFDVRRCIKGTLTHVSFGKCKRYPAPSLAVFRAITPLPILSAGSRLQQTSIEIASNRYIVILWYSGFLGFPMVISTRRPSLRRPFLMVFTCALLSSSAAVAFTNPSADQPSDFKPNDQARDLVRRVVANELKQEEIDKSRYMFKLKKVSSKGTRIQQIVQTSQGSIARTLSVNGQPPTDDVRQAEEQKIQKLIGDPDEQKRRQKREKEDENRAQIMVRALPNAFFYEEIGRDSDTIKLRFHPDPNYQPQSREESIYTGMAAELWLNLPQQRLRKIDAHLFHDVDFGWGILGRLYKGGSFMVEQEQVDANHWDTTVLKLDLRGKALLFKSLVYDEQEYETEFRRLPDHVSLSEGADILKKGAPELAQKSGQ